MLYTRELMQSTAAFRSFSNVCDLLENKYSMLSLTYGDENVDFKEVKK